MTFFDNNWICCYCCQMNVAKVYFKNYFYVCFFTTFHLFKIDCSNFSRQFLSLSVICHLVTSDELPYEIKNSILEWLVNTEKCTRIFGKPHSCVNKTLEDCKVFSSFHSVEHKLCSEYFSMYYIWHLRNSSPSKSVGKLHLAFTKMLT